MAVDAIVRNPGQGRSLGLSSREADDALGRFGPNRLPSEPASSRSSSPLQDVLHTVALPVSQMAMLSPHCPACWSGPSWKPIRDLGADLPS